MKFSELLAIVGDEPTFETGLLLAGEVDPNYVRRQLSLWVKAGKLYQLRRGIYALAPPYEKVHPHPFLIANRLVRGSYVSCQSGLAHYGLIPEYVPLTQSVSIGRPGWWETPLGNFEYRHIADHLYQGYRQIEVDSGQWAFVAAPEKALLDLVHLTPGGDSPAYLGELRLQNLEQFDLEILYQFATLPKLQRAADVIVQMVEWEKSAYQTL